MDSRAAFPPRIGRRRAIAVLAAAAGWPLLPAASGAAAPARYAWRGRALGAEARLVFAHPERTLVRAALQRCLAEIARLERVFSLFREDSELVRLNRTGRLDAASHDLRAVLAEAAHLARLSDGAFDVTLQPLWRLYADWAASRRGPPGGPAAADLARALARVDHRALVADGAAVRLAKPGMALTLNGIAQGYITDRVATLLRQAGFAHVLIQLGETFALGEAARGRPWRVGLPGGVGEPPAGVLDLVDRAAATSSGAAMVFDAGGRHHHLLDPRTGASPQRYASVSVVAPRAVAADGLSTALSLLPAERAPALLAAGGGERALLVAADGRRRWVEPAGG